MTIEERILVFFKDKGVSSGLEYETDLFSHEYINSLFALEMVVYLEDTFKIKLANKDINKQNFSTVSKLAALVRSYGGK